VLHVPSSIAQDAITERPSRTLEPPPGRRPNHTVRDQAALLLKSAHRNVDRVVEGCIPLLTAAFYRLAGKQPEQSEMITNLSDSWPPVAEAIRRRRHSTSAGLSR
jgi:hypothetical protein